jgi:hypothetical protein
MSIADARFSENEAAGYQAQGIYELAAVVWLKTAQVWALQLTRATTDHERRECIAGAADAWRNLARCARQAADETERNNLN